MRHHPVSWGVLALSTLAFATPAQAARHEVSFEFHDVQHDDDSLWDLYRSEGVPSFGLRGGGAVLQDKERFGLVVTGGWVRGRRGASVWPSNEGGEREFANVFLVDTFTVGAKADYDVANLFYPYVHVQAGLLRADIAVDGDPGDSDNAQTQLSGAGVAPAGLFSLGFELMLPDRTFGWPVTAAVFFEAGWQETGKLSFGELGGETQLDGALLRTGIGLRF